MIIKGDFDNVSYLYIHYDMEGEPNYLKPEDLYAIGYHKGSYDTTKETYRRIMDYVNRKGYSIVGNAYEDSLLDYSTQNVEDDCLIKIT